MTTTSHYFTFGSDHAHEGVPLRDRYVEVIAPEGVHRTLFMAWLGSNRFASEYYELEWAAIFRAYKPVRFALISVEVTP